MQSRISDAIVSTITQLELPPVAEPADGVSYQYCLSCGVHVPRDNARRHESWFIPQCMLCVTTCAKNRQG